MSLERRRGCSRASTMWPARPLWKSRTEVSQRMAAPSTSSRGDQVRCERHTSALFCSSQLSTEMDLPSLGSLATFCYLAPFWGPTSLSSSSWTCLFPFRSGIAFSPRLAGSGGGSVGGTWDLVASFEVDTLFQVAMRSLKLLFPLLNAILSSSSF